MWQGLESALGAAGAAPPSPKPAPLIIPANLVASQQQMIRSMQSAARTLCSSMSPSCMCRTHVGGRAVPIAAPSRWLACPCQKPNNAGAARVHSVLTGRRVEISSLLPSTVLSVSHACAEFMAAYDLAGSSEMNRQLLAFMRSRSREASHAASLTWAVSADMALTDFTATAHLAKQAVEAIAAYQKAP